MSSNAEDRLIEERLDKLARLKKAGVMPYPSVSERTHTATQFDKEFDALVHSGKSVTIVGRIRAMRRMGKAAFAKLEDGSGSTQVFLQQDTLGPAYEIVRLLEIGDFIQVSGVAFSTKTGEATVRVEKVTVLTKAIRPLPDKFHGLKDQELRFRRRELDLVSNANIRDLFKHRANFLRYLRDFLDAQGFMEVETPVLQSLPGGTEAKPFITHHEALDIDLYLRIAPELFLKRLIVGGFEKVYEIGKVFRNEGISPQHLQEFTEMEFYWAYASYRDLMPLTEKMIAEVLKKTFGTLSFKYGDAEIDFTPPWPRLDYYNAVKEKTGIDLEKIKDAAELREQIIARKLDVHLETNMGLGRMIDNLFKATVRPTIIQPTHLTGYPLTTSPLAKLDQERPDRVERFQVIVSGFEITNAYSELNDPQDQKQRFEEQAKLREAGDTEAHVNDEEFVQALEYGMPPTAGFGMGIDRILALATNASNVREVVFFPLLRPEK